MEREDNEECAFSDTPLFSNLRKLINLMDDLSDIGLH